MIYAPKSVECANCKTIGSFCGYCNGGSNLNYKNIYIPKYIIINNKLQNINTLGDSWKFKTTQLKKCSIQTFQSDPININLDKLPENSRPIKSSKKRNIHNKNIETIFDNNLQCQLNKFIKQILQYDVVITKIKHYSASNTFYLTIAGNDEHKCKIIGDQHKSSIIYFHIKGSHIFQKCWSKKCKQKKTDNVELTNDIINNLGVYGQINRNMNQPTIKFNTKSDAIANIIKRLNLKKKRINIIKKKTNK
jgi:hypothetical protein